MIDNKLGWVLMEIPVLIVTAIIYIYAQGWHRLTATILVSFLTVHYIQRSLIYPFMMRGKSKIPITHGCGIQRHKRLPHQRLAFHTGP